MSKSISFDSQKTDSSTSSSQQQTLPEAGQEIIVDKPSESEIVLTATPEPVKADLPPNGSALKISFKPTANGGIKRLAESQDPADDSSTYDITPRISPTSDAAPTGNKGDVEVNGGDGNAPKRAPRKKRKWLKRGEGECVFAEHELMKVDPDDPIAVAKQRDRHAMIDEYVFLHVRWIATDV
jgi:hypothetical protein